ncbi:autotransporter-associated beta strand repeat-containing protein [Luteolibacter arcticus]|uniref:Autotransporter-associated beta strand repeat-containing protein n=1 Tax=Luteolibacter arcticus TaxID=1581411 RepID=A0ABT3GS59_9BACT|nr:autotransporter-associated beta strand repeat-containing protein [Luteolibacter arcticus]MCW1926321.1 autotransporter-associated beta strand repeat-containing protein [Luteolibacter arcticus]
MKTSVFLAPAYVLFGAVSLSALPALADSVTMTGASGGTWTDPLIWSNGLAPAPENDYSVTSKTLAAPSLTTAATATFAGGNLAISSGTLSFPGSSGGTVTHTYAFTGGELGSASATNPATAVQVTGSSLTFASTNGTTKAVNARFNFSGSNIIDRTGSNFTHNLNFNRALYGSGTLTFNFTNNGSGAGRNVNIASGLANAYSGTVVLNNASTSNGGVTIFSLGSSLGTGSYEIRNGWSLNNNVASGLDAAPAITLVNSASRLVLTNPWNNSAGALTVTNGTVSIGNAASSIGNLTGAAGTIQGVGVSSSLTVNQTTNGTYAGALGFTAGNGLAFTKAGAANLRLTGTINPAIPVTLNDGGLGVGTNTLASLTQNGGSLLLDLGVTPVISGNYSRAAGDIAVQVSSPPALGTPYTLVTYQGALTSNPPVTFAGLGDTRLAPAVNYGAGSNSAISVTFSGTAAALVWNGPPGGTWDINSSSNWTNGGSPDKYYQFDHVSFTDAATGSPSVVLSQVATPGSVVFDHSMKNYTLSGSGAIGGITTLTKSGTGTLTIANNNSYTGDTIISNGTLQIGAGGTTGSIGSGAVANAGTLAFNRSDVSTVANVISGAGALSQLGSGTTILTADSGYTGSTTITAGTLQVGNGGASGSLGVTSAITTNGTLAFNRTGTLTIAPEITGTGALLQSGPGTVVLAAGAGHTGGTTIAAGTLVIGNGGTTGSITGLVTSNGTLGIQRSDDLDFANVVSGSGSIDHRGTGILRLTGANSYTGTTGVSGGGRLELDSSGSSIPAGTGLLLASGTLDFNDLNLTVSSFTKTPAGSVDVVADPGKTLTVQGGNFLANQGGLSLTMVDSFVLNSPAGSFNAVTTASGGNASVTAGYLTNTITAGSFGIANGGPGGAAVTSNASVTLGESNTINADTIAIGVNGAENGITSLRCDASNSSLVIRGTAGGSSRANMTLGHKKDSDYAGGSAAVEVLGSGSTLDAMLGTLVIGRHSTGTGNFNRATSGNFTFGAGTLDATTIQLGIGEAPNIKTANGTIATTDGVIKTETLTLVQDSGGPMGTATVSVAGTGALQATTITGQAATNATVLLNDTATLRNTPGSNLTVSGTTLEISSVATALLSIGSGNDVLFDAGSVFEFHYFSDPVNFDFGKLTASGATILSNASLSLIDENAGPAAFTTGQKFVLIDYTAGSLTGTFTGLDDGAIVTVGSQNFVIDYDDPAYAGKAVTLTAAAAGSTYATWAMANAGGEGANGDYDKDGVPNAVEYLMGQTGSTFTPNPQVVGSKITWPKDPLAQATWVVQTSSNLAAEGQPGGWADATFGVADLDTSIEFMLPVGSSKVFARLKVTVP